MSDQNYRFPIRPEPPDAGAAHPALSFTETPIPLPRTVKGRECTTPERHEQLHTLAQQFHQANQSSIRRQLFGGALAGVAAVAKHQPLIEEVVRELASRSPRIAVDARLVQSIMYVENDYNGGDFNSRTTLPMNVNFNAWKPLLENHGITREAMHNPRTNITAAALILHHLDSRTPCDITDPHERRAIVASLYGNTSITRDVQRPIPYGAAVAEAYQKGVFVNPAQPLAHEFSVTRACRANEAVTLPPAWCASMQSTRSTPSR